MAAAATVSKASANRSIRRRGRRAAAGALATPRRKMDPFPVEAANGACPWSPPPPLLLVSAPAAARGEAAAAASLPAAADTWGVCPPTGAAADAPPRRRDRTPVFAMMAKRPSPERRAPAVVAANT